MSLIEILVDQANSQAKYFKDYRTYAKKIKRTISNLLEDPGVRLLVFGSVVNGKYVASMSDIDILVISEKISLKASWQSRISADVLRELGDIFSPFEIHFATPKLYQGWYSNFIKSDYVEIS